MDHREKGMYVVYVYCMRIRKQSMAPLCVLIFTLAEAFEAFEIFLITRK